MTAVTEEWGPGYEDLERLYIGRIEDFARTLVGSGEYWTSKWSLRGSMLERVRTWFTERIPLFIVHQGQIEAFRGAEVGDEIKVLFLYYLSLERVVLAAWARLGYPKMDPWRDIPRLIQDDLR